MNTTHLDFYNYDTKHSIVTIDASVYNPDVAITEPTLEITPPNFSCASNFTYNPNHSFNLNSFVLNWSPQDCLTILPDGLWVYKLSVCPNQELYKIKNYLRIYSTKNTILDRVTSVRDRNDEKEAQRLLMMLNDLEVAKYMVEVLCEVEKGVILYNSICSQLEYCTYC